MNKILPTKDVTQIGKVVELGQRASPDLDIELTALTLVCYQNNEQVSKDIHHLRSDVCGFSFPIANLVPHRGGPEVQCSALWFGRAQSSQLIAICRMYLMKDTN